MSEESFLVGEGDEYYEWRRRADGWWQKEPMVKIVGTVGELLDKQKSNRRLKPIKGSKVAVVDDDGLLNVQKGAYEDEQQKLLERIERLEKILLPYEQKSMQKIQQGGILFIGQPSIKVKLVQQPSVKREEVKLEEIANKVVKGILHGEFTQRGYDGTPYLMKNVQLMLKKKAKQLRVS